MGITAKELAKQLGLSTAAVSMALNGKRGVSESTRARVLDAAKKGGYDFERLRGKEDVPKGTIAFLLYKRHGAVVGDTPFFSSLSDGVAEACRSEGYNLRLYYLYEESLKQDLQAIFADDIAGAILLGTEMRQQDFAPFASFSLPLVVMDMYFEGINRDCVLINNVQGAFAATNYLISKRKQQPGYLRSAYPIANFEERADGFYKAIRFNGMAAGASPVHRLAPSADGAYADMKALIAQGDPLAKSYFADNDLIAAGAMRALKEAGYRVPQDIGIIGFDNTPMCEVSDPPMTTIHVPKQDMGMLAMQRLVLRMRDKRAAHVKIEVETTIVKRGTL